MEYDEVKNRELDISEILLHNPIDLQSIHHISRLNGGFISNSIRQQVWPKLLGINPYTDSKSKYNPRIQSSSVQVDCDIAR